MNRAIYPGRFDPVTLGHLDIIERASKIFDELVVCVLDEGERSCFFTVEERTKLLQMSTGHIPNLRFVKGSGTLPNIAKEHSCCVVIRGLRVDMDFEREYQISQIGSTVAPEIETVFLAASARNIFITSDAVKTLMKFNTVPDFLVPKEIIPVLQKKCQT